MMSTRTERILGRLLIAVGVFSSAVPIALAWVHATTGLDGDWTPVVLAHVVLATITIPGGIGLMSSADYRDRHGDRT